MSEGILETILDTQRLSLETMKSLERRISRLEPCGRYLQPGDVLNAVCEFCGKIMVVHNAGDQLPLFDTEQ